MRWPADQILHLVWIGRAMVQLDVLVQPATRLLRPELRFDCFFCHWLHHAVPIRIGVNAVNS